MSMPSPFETGRAISQNISGAFAKQRDAASQRAMQRQDVSAIDQILQDAIGTEDESIVEDAMRRIISQVSPERQAAALNLLQNKQKGIREKLQAQKKIQESTPDLSGAVNALNSIEQLVGQSGIGLTGAVNPSASARFNRGKFESLQAAILPIFKGMFPRGMTEKEFKFIQENYIPQVNDTEQKIKGKLAGLRQLIGQQDQMVSPLVQMQQQTSTQERPPLSSFSR